MRKAASLIRRSRLTNRRGAAFLLAVYFSAMMLLLLGGVSLQRTMTDVKASQVSRDLHRSHWAADAGFDQAIAVLRARDLPTFNALGCAYGAFTFQESGGRADYMICQGRDRNGIINPEQFTVDVMGRGPEAVQSFGRNPADTETWITGLLQRKIPQVTLSHAVVGLEKLTLSKAVVGGVHSRDPYHPLGVVYPGYGFVTDSHGDRRPHLAQFFNDQGHIATRSRKAGALSILNGSWLFGKAMTSASEALSVDSSTSRWVVSASGENPISQMEFPPVKEPSTATPLKSVMPGSLVDDQGNVFMRDQYGMLSQGTYQAKNLALDHTTLVTDGPVDLFVVGSLTIDQSSVYGTPLTTNGYGGLYYKITAPQYSPPDLRIFVRPVQEGDKVLIRRGSLLAGVLYAPHMEVKINRKSMVLGGLVGKTAQIGLLPTEAGADAEADPDAHTKVYYDQAIRGLPIKPRPEDPLAKVLFYHINRDRRINASNLSWEDQQRLAQWFSLVDRNAVVGAPTTVSASGGGGSYTGGCGGTGGYGILGTW